MIYAPDLDPFAKDICMHVYKLFHSEVLTVTGSMRKRAFVFVLGIGFLCFKYIYIYLCMLFFCIY